MSDLFADSAPAFEVPLPPEPPGETAIVSPRAGRPSPAAVTAPPMSTFTGWWLDQQTFPPVGWILPGIIPEGQTLLVAPPKAGKSWLVYALALARARGGMVLGQRISAGPVLYLALEDGHRRLQDRGRTLLAPGESLPESINYAIRTNPLTFTADLQRWIGEHAGRRPLVIIDTLGKVKQPARSGGSQYEHDYAEMSMLKALVDDEPGAAMILVHHDRKAASDDFLDNVSGTHGLAGAADTTVVINRPRTGANGVLSVTGREVPEAEYAVTFDAGTWTLDGADLKTARQTVIDRRAAGNLGERSTEILKFVQAHPEGVRPRDVAQAFSIEGKEATKYLGRLEQAGRIDRPERGTYTPGVSGATGVTDGDAPTEGPRTGYPTYPSYPATSQRRGTTGCPSVRASGRQDHRVPHLSDGRARKRRRVTARPEPGQRQESRHRPRNRDRRLPRPARRRPHRTAHPQRRQRPRGPVRYPALTGPRRWPRRRRVEEHRQARPRTLAGRSRNRTRQRRRHGGRGHPQEARRR